MDGLSIPLVEAARALLFYIQKYRSSTKDVKDLEREFLNLCSNLEVVEQTLDAPLDSIVHQFRARLEENASVLRLELENAVRKFQKLEGNIAIKLHFALKNSEIERLKGLASNYNRSIDSYRGRIVLNRINSIQGESQHQATGLALDPSSKEKTPNLDPTYTPFGIHVNDFGSVNSSESTDFQECIQEKPSNLVEVLISRNDSDETVCARTDDHIQPSAKPQCSGARVDCQQGADTSKTTAAVSIVLQSKPQMKRSRVARKTFTVPQALLIVYRRVLAKSRTLPILRHISAPRYVSGSSEAIACIKAHNYEGLLALIKSGKAHPRERTTDEWNLLHYAGYFSTEKIVRLLIGLSKVDLTSEEVGTRTPVDLARIRSLRIDATDGDRSRARSFPDHENFQESFGFTSVHLATVDYPDNVDPNLPSLSALLQFVQTLSLGKNFNEQYLHEQMNIYRKGQTRSSRLYLDIIAEFVAALHEKRGSNFNLIDKTDERNGWTPLMWAAYTGRLSNMHLLIDYGADPTVKTPKGRNILHQAAESRQPGIMKLALHLMDQSIERKMEGSIDDAIDINLRDVWGETPLHVASETSPECVELLLKRGAKRDVRNIDEGAVALHYAGTLRAKDKPWAVKLLAADRGAHINAVIDCGRTPLFYLLDSPHSVQILLEHGADCTLRDVEGKSVLHQACIGNHAAALKILLGHCSESFQISQDISGDRPLAVAFKHGSAECALVLLKAGAIGESMIDGMPLAHLAARMGDVDVLEWCFTHNYQRGMKTADGKSVRQVAFEASTNTGRIQGLISKYEAYDNLPAPEPGSKAARDAEHAQARADYFILR